MTNTDIILEALEELSPASYCDDCLSRHAAIFPRAQVNIICRKLASQGLVSRSKALCPQCNRRKLVNSLVSLVQHNAPEGAHKISEARSPSSSPYPPQSPIDIEHLRNEVVRICLQMWPVGSRNPRPRSISKVINILREEGTIPRHQANMMLTICGLRNVYLWDSVPMGSDETEVARAAWSIIAAWSGHTPDR